MPNTINSLVKTLKEKNLMLALCESVTCGMAAQKLNTVKGTTEVLIGSLVCYHSSAKTGALNISPRLIKKYSAESQQVTDALSKNLHKVLPADIFASITGLASPGGSESKTKPVGTIFLSIYFRKNFYRRKQILRGTPVEIKKKATKVLFEFIHEVIKKN